MSHDVIVQGAKLGGRTSLGERQVVPHGEQGGAQSALQLVEPQDLKIIVISLEI